MFPHDEEYWATELLLNLCMLSVSTDLPDEELIPLLKIISLCQDIMIKKYVDYGLCYDNS